MENREKAYLKAFAIVILFFVLTSATASAATLTVGSTSKYKTIQSAVNAAHDGDTIKVAYGTYKENVKVNKVLTILGTSYPKVDGFYLQKWGKTINGFSIQKYGISSDYNNGGWIIRNNYFYNCGIELSGSMSEATIMNNQIKNGTIDLYDTVNENITGNTVSYSKVGLYVGDLAHMPTVTKNTFKNCQYAVYFYGLEHSPGLLTTFSGNVYSGNKVNFGWGWKTENQL